VIVGVGPELPRLMNKAAKNVEFLGQVDESRLRNVYAQCRALLFAADEDFGMVPLEAQSYGRPVIAYGKGGALETVLGTFPPVGEYKANGVSERTGVFFQEQTADSLANAIRSFESAEESFLPQQIQLHARKFDTSVFLDRLRSYIDCAMEKSTKSDGAAILV